MSLLPDVYPTLSLHSYKIFAIDYLPILGSSGDSSPRVNSRAKTNIPNMRILIRFGIRS